MVSGVPPPTSDASSRADAQDSSRRPITFASHTEKIGNDDACLRWLQRKYASGVPASKPLPFIEDDVRACDTLHWSRFAFPSEPHTPLRSNYNNESSNPAPVKAVVVADSKADSTGIRPITVALESKKKAAQVSPTDSDEASSGCAGISSNSFREVIFARDAERRLQARPSPPSSWQTTIATSSAGDGTNASPAPRPYLGGYVAAPQLSDSLRFLLFPQAHHAHPEASDGTSESIHRPYNSRGHRPEPAPQEVPFYLRGSASLPVRGAVSLAEAERTAAFVPAESATLSIAASQKLPSRKDSNSSGDDGLRWWQWLLPLSVRVASADVELALRSSRTERRYVPEKEKVEKRRLHGDSVRVTIHPPDPRRGTRVAASHTVVEDSHRRYQAPKGARNDAVTGFTLEDVYDSTVQRLGLTAGKSGGLYRLRWTAGPGVERCTSDGRTTVFARFRTESWVEWPLTVRRRRFNLRLRNQSGLLWPLEWAADPAAAHVNGDAEKGEGQPASWLRRSRPHEYLWATQGPKWNPKLLRGFDDDYSSMHHSEQWYSAFSIELSKKRERVRAAVAGPAGGPLPSGSEDGDENGDAAPTATSGSMWGNANAMAFANACFVDSFYQYPRASVGLSLTSETPRLTIDAFNRLIPQRFECSFSWFVAFKEGRLQTGLQNPALPEPLQFMRLSPVETFRHMKCGLTWRL